MANGDVDVTEGSGLKVGSYTISEDAVTRHLQRVALNNSSGNELATGSGVNGATVLRVALATDSPGLTSAGQLDKASSLSVTPAIDQEAVGVVPRAHSTQPTAVASGAPIFLISNRHGVQFVIGGHPNSICRSHLIADSDGAQTNATLSPTITGAMVVTQLNVRADKDNSGNVTVKIGFANAGGSLTTPSLAGVVGIIFNEELGAGDGHQIGNGAGIIGIGAANEELLITCSDPAGGNIYVNYTYYTVES